MTQSQLIAQRLSDAALSQSRSAARKAHGAAAVPSGAALPDELTREVYCILGIPIDAVDMAEALRRIKSAARLRVRYLVSTPNLNFLINSRSNSDFRESLLQSDLCAADGMPLVWIARIIGLPIRERVAGSDMFEALRGERNAASPLKVFLFGGPEGIAASAARALNAGAGGLTCVGTMFPGYGNSDAMSTDEIIDTVNASGADVLMVGLSAAKGQAWLRRNHQRVSIPVRAQVGAAISFQAGTIRRSPVAVRRLGLEWLWRIKEEPHLWRRYWRDGAALLKLLAIDVLPLAVEARWHLRTGLSRQGLQVDRAQDANALVLRLSGAATARNIEPAIAWFRDAVATGQSVTLDFSGVRHIDARFFGLLLMLRKQLAIQGHNLDFTGISPRTERVFNRNGLGFLLRGPTASSLGAMGVTRAQ